MRKLLTLTALTIATMVATTAPAVASPTTPAVPTCVVSHDGHGGDFTTSVTCVRLIQHDGADIGAGRFDPGDHGFHTLTVTVEYRRSLLPPFVWHTLTSATAHGFGRLTATTPPVPAPFLGDVRACAYVDGREHRLCTP